MGKNNLGKCLVTGGTGFVGSHLIDYLLAGGAEIICPVRNPRDIKYLSHKKINITSFDKWTQALGKGGNLDYVFHVAGATRGLSYRDYYRANVELTETLLEDTVAVANSGRFKRFVFISSQAVSGPANNIRIPVHESDPCSPVSLYGQSKFEAEEILSRYFDKIPCVILRPSTVFGPRDTDVLGVFKSCKYHVAPCLSGKNRLVSMIYVKDLVEGIVEAALSKKTIGRTYFLTNQNPVVWRDFIGEVAAVMDSSVLVLPIPRFILYSFGFISDLIGNFTTRPLLLRTEKIREMDQQFWICSPELAQKDFGWIAKDQLRKNLHETYQWYKTQGWL